MISLRALNKICSFRMIIGKSYFGSQKIPRPRDPTMPESFETKLS
jgi:hypothetical protein